MSGTTGRPLPTDGPEADVPQATRRWAGSIQTKLLVMLLLSSILAAGVVGFFGYRSGTEALRETSFARLTDLREQRTTAVREYIERERAAAILNSRGISVDALAAFDAAFGDLRDAKITAGERQALTAYYTDEFVPTLQKASDGELQADSFIPTAPARSYLQAHYTVTPDDEKLALTDPGDSSGWTEAHTTYHPFYREVMKRTGAEDVLLLNLDGDVVYSAFKGVDLGSNVKRGEFRGGGLEEVYDKAIRSNSDDFVAISDLELYQPALNAPTGFVASPVVDGTEVIGVYVSQIPISRLDTLMTGDSRDGVVTGLGKTGETYLAGPDDLMRSNSRELMESPKKFAEDAVERGTPPHVVDRIVAAGSTVLRQPVRSEAHELASQGKSGTIVTTDYLGHEILGSYSPAEIEGLNWTVIARMDTAEAFAPVREFTRDMLLATAAVVLLIAAASVLMARVFTAPLHRLLNGVRAVTAGDFGARVDAGSRDEFGDLAAAFNDMSASLRSKHDLLDLQQKEHERLLRTMMPENVMTRYRGGETGIADEHQDVTVTLAEIEGFDEFAASKSTEEALNLLESLSRSVSEVARSTGVEKVRATGTSYVMSSGLVVQRVDHVRRAADFAVGVAEVVDRFNTQHGAALTLRSGIDTGPVRSGLLGQDGVVYDLWGEAVNLAYRLRSVPGEPGIHVSDAVKDQLVGAYTVERAGTITSGQAERTVWRLVTRSGSHD
jgi:class 3 adenylate cyclase